ncbi:sulfotransferase domain-containing protein [Allorhodopirellula solitaria]|uniref:Sulfotransferase domain protein n=1 Tax=Allorhodopirellula solitaria TaxID=2527987 RepID=A0A5C5XQ29_9BACT|nr:sulfotransferase domain-containing protein [Allorhodopirellula solitaria]TWT65336.1 Sulfotransferase domain protein [Allorhodopirellula solitaria]
MNPVWELIRILRNPVERAYSSFLYTTAQGFEPETSFAAALDAESQRIEAGWHHIWHYTEMGYYCQQLAPFLEAFGRERVMVLIYEQLCQSDPDLIRSVAEFIGAAPERCPDDCSIVNTSGVPRHEMIGLLGTAVHRYPKMKSILKRGLPHRWLEQARSAGLRKPPMRMRDRQRLNALFKREVTDLEQLLDIQLPQWQT